MNTVLKTINQTTVFLLEIIMLISYGYFGLSQTWSFTSRLFFTIFIIGTVITLWAIFAAPKSGHRLEMPYLALFRAFMFLTAAILLFKMGHKYLAVCLMGLTIITQTISFWTEK